MSLGVSISLLVTFLIFPVLLLEVSKIGPNLSFENKFNLPELVAKFANNYGTLSLVFAFAIFILNVGLDPPHQGYPGTRIGIQNCGCKITLKSRFGKFVGADLKNFRVLKVISPKSVGAGAPMHQLHIC